MSYSAHIDVLLRQWREILAANDFDAAVVQAGSNRPYFKDDQEPPFHAFGHFLRWVPYNDCEHCVLFVSQQESPMLFWYSPKDYWYLPSSAPEICENKFLVRTFDSLDVLHTELKRCLKSFRNVACFGDDPILPVASKETNDRTLAQLDHRRAFKTEFEKSCMRLASERACRGHLAAEEAFFAGGSELEINHAFLGASEQHQAELPYPNIVGLNEHAATLHYQQYQRRSPENVYSLLIDAGATNQCYHADVTRTYAKSTTDEFQALIKAVDEAQQSIIEAIKVGDEYLALHERMHQFVAKILVDQDFIECTPESAFERRITDVFFPHGLGHLLGLQTHDVGGWVPEEDGIERTPHERYDSLRILRNIAENMVFTIEPGIYFIPTLLEAWSGHQDFNWSKINLFKAYGGVRIEDNVLVSSHGVENLTRDAFNRVAPGSS